MDKNKPIANPEAAGDKPPHRRPCLRWGCFGLIILCLVAVAGVILLRFKTRSAFTDAQWQQMQTMSTKVINPGPDWQKPVPVPSDALLQFTDDLSQRIEHILEAYDNLLFENYSTGTLLAKMRRGEYPDSDQQTSYSALMKEMHELADLTSEAVHLPEYTAEPGFETVSGTSFLTMQTLSKLMGIAALDQARQGHCLRAMDTVMLPVRAIRRPANASMITHLVSGAVAVISASTMSTLAEQCTDTLAIRHGLELMTELRDAAFPGEIKNWKYGNSIGSLQRAAGYGYPADLTPRPLLDYSIDAGYLVHHDFDWWIISHDNSSSHSVAMAKARLASRHAFAEFTEGTGAERTDKPEYPAWQRSLGKIVFGVDSLALYYGLNSREHDDNEAKAKVALAIYDLTRLRLAERLKQLGAPVDPASALGQSLDVSDPFTGQGFPEAQDAHFSEFSVGPDGASNDMKIPYDASNGAISGGDVWAGDRE